MERQVYMDYNATTPLKEEVKAAISSDLNNYGNASSLHSRGRFAGAKVDDARASVAALLGADSGDIIFTSGGSESNNTVFETMRRLALKDGKRNEFIISVIEHPCILYAAEHLKSLGCKIRIIPVDKDGKIKMDDYKAALNSKTLLVSVMMANNEIGTIQDMKEISRLAKEAGAWMHSDAVQAAGKIRLDVKDLGLDYLSLSSHKFYGPKGIGALYVSKEKKAPLTPLIHGHQEGSLRAGTYNDLGIMGLGKAAELAVRDLGEFQKKTSALKTMLKDGLFKAVPDIIINGHQEDVLSNTLNLSFPGAEGEAILLRMDMDGIEVSTGSACASGSLEPSHVLTAIGLGPELAHSSIRFSLGWMTNEEDVDYVIKKLPKIIEELRAMSTVKA